MSRSLGMALGSNLRMLLTESKNQLIREETSRLEQEREELKQRIQAAKNAKVCVECSL